MSGRPLSPEELDAAVRLVLGDRWAATGVLDDVLVVAAVEPTPEDVTALQELAPGAGVVPVAFSREQLEVFMDSVEEQLHETGELEGFLQMSPDGFSGTVRLLVDRPVPQLQAWAADHLPSGCLRLEQVEA